ncbi:MAG: PP2C family protein-serine/threonine phosphatase, partial [Polyangiaceae bacterium]
MSSRDDRGPTAKPVPAPHPRAISRALAEGEIAPAPLRRTGYGVTDLGRKRSSNEDAFFMDDELGLYVVADGMGGHAAGEVASREAVDTLYGMVKRGIGELHELVAPLSPADSRAACRLMESAVQAATYFVYSIAEIDRDKSGMGTTISALLVLGEFAVTAQVGDSRIYCVHDDEVEQLTEDHTLIAWQLKQGLITPQEAARSPHKNVITRAVGNREYVQVDTRCVPLAPFTRLLLCSDGLHG